MNANARVLTGVLCGTAIAFPSSGADWQVGLSPTTNNLNAIACGQSQTVAVGPNSTILMSADGATWRRVPIPEPNLTLNAVAYGSGMFGIAGDADYYSYDEGTNWTRASGGFWDKTIFGLAHGAYYFVGVGIINSNQQPAIFSTHGAWSWPQRVAAAPNILRAVTYGRNTFVGVGDAGLIMTSGSDVYNWTQRVSRTSANLRAVTWAASRFIAAGDDGAVLMSPDGITWTLNAPASFSVRALAGSRSEVVAVGTFGAAGRLHESLDGTTWPGNATHYASPLNAIARHAGGNYLAVGNGGTILQSVVTINNWISPASGDWQDDFWSLGHLPSMDETAVMLTNAGWKAVAIQASTAANYANTLRVKSLTVDAPTDSATLLLLNYAGLSTALAPVNDLTVGSNGSLLSYYSAIDGGTLTVAGGRATFAELAQTRFANVYVTNGAKMVLSNGWFSAQQAIVSGSNATVMRQFGGTNAVDALRLNSGARYFLSDGSLITPRLDVWWGLPHLSGLEPAPLFVQSGGRVETSLLFTDNGAVYELTAGILAANYIRLGGGARLELKGGTVISNQSLSVNGGMLMLVPDGEYRLGHLLPNGGRIDFGTGRKTLRFTGIGYPPPVLDGTVTIRNWTGPASSPERDRLYIGDNSASGDLRVVYFMDPGGYPPGQYFAKGMPDGEVIPLEPQSLRYVRTTNQLILTWPEGFTLTAADDVAGPYHDVYGATSPYPVSFAGPRRFFKLRPIL